MLRDRLKNGSVDDTKQARSLCAKVYPEAAGSDALPAAVDQLLGECSGEHNWVLRESFRNTMELFLRATLFANFMKITAHVLKTSTWSAACNLHTAIALVSKMRALGIRASSNQLVMQPIMALERRKQQQCRQQVAHSAFC